MWAIFLILGQVWATATAQVTPSADCMLVIRKMWCGLGTALSQRKSVQPSTKIVRHFSSSATGPSAGVLPLEVIPQKKSIFSDSFSRRSSLTLASVPAASSALRISIFRLPRRPPAALISSAARSWPLYMGSPSTAAGPVKNVMWPILYGVSGILPLGFSCACATPTDGMTDPAEAVSAAPTLTPSVLKKSRRFTSAAILIPPLGSLPSDGRLRCATGVVALTSGPTHVKTPGTSVLYNDRSGRFVPGNYSGKSHVETCRRSRRDGVAGHSCRGARPPGRVPRDRRRGARAPPHPPAHRARRHAQALDVLRVQSVAQEASRVRDVRRDAREEARLPVTRGALLVHGRRSLRRSRVGLRRRHD